MVTPRHPPPTQVRDHPPNWARLEAAFGPLPPGVIVAYGDRVYVPSGKPLPRHLVIHESVHLRQQADAGGPDAWWDRYIDDRDFRLEQEVEAYRVQYRSMNRRERRELGPLLARDLSGPMYGSLVTDREARLLIGFTRA